MYEIYVAAKDFKDKRTVQQHRLVNEVCFQFKSPFALVVISQPFIFHFCPSL